MDCTEVYAWVAGLGGCDIQDTLLFFLIQVGSHFFMSLLLLYFSITSSGSQTFAMLLPVPVEGICSLRWAEVYGEIFSLLNDLAVQGPWTLPQFLAADFCSKRQCRENTGAPRKNFMLIIGMVFLSSILLPPGSNIITSTEYCQIFQHVFGSQKGLPRTQ